MRIQVRRVISRERAFSGRVRIRVEPLDFEGKPMPGSKSFIVLDTTFDDLFGIVYNAIQSKEKK